MSAAELAPYIVAKETPVAQLKAETAFAGLTEKEAAYAKAVYDACWAGNGIVLLQTSPESPAIFSLLRLAFADGVKALSDRAAAAGVSKGDVDAFVMYAANFLDNSGNYRSFGDTKLIPSISAEAFEKVLQASSQWAVGAATAAQPFTLQSLWAAVKGPMYDLTPRLRQLGVGPEGVTTYYSANFTEEDGARVSRFLESTGIPQPYNQRVFKYTSPPPSIAAAAAGATGGAAASAGGGGAASGGNTTGVYYEIRIASGATEPVDALVTAPALTAPVVFEGCTFVTVRGDYSPLMARVSAHLTKALHHTANAHQYAMLRRYVGSFQSGSMEDHIDGSKHWVKDVGPVVESYLGFIESYRDPLGTRGEWEGFVAVVNKETSAKFKELVDQAEPLLSLMPWGAPFEKDVFRRPDFTALEVLGFCGSGIPAGINIPNYDDVRQNVGFKNVSLSNVLSARDFKDRVTFLRDADQDVYRTKVNPAFEVQVGLHELLGHGSGKIFAEADDGTLNFKPSETIDPLTGAPVATWYKPGQTWDSMFGSVASAMEECRAEAVGIYLCVRPQVLSIFGHGDAAEGADIVYANWLNMARAGLLALQFYTPATKKWGQAHMQARFALLQVMLEAGHGFVEIVGASELTADKVATATEGEGGVHVRMDRSKIETVGWPAVGDFLRKLQVYKSTANVAAGTALFEKYTTVPESWLPLRDLVVAKRKPRQLFVQPVLEEVAADAATGADATDGSVVVKGVTQSKIQMRTFPATAEGVVSAFVARFPLLDTDLLHLWEKEAAVHKLA